MNHAEQYLQDELTSLEDKLRNARFDMHQAISLGQEKEADLTAKIADIQDALAKLKPAPKKTAAKR